MCIEPGNEQPATRDARWVTRDDDLHKIVYLKNWTADAGIPSCVKPTDKVFAWFKDDRIKPGLCFTQDLDWTKVEKFQIMPQKSLIQLRPPAMVGTEITPDGGRIYTLAYWTHLDGIPQGLMDDTVVDLTYKNSNVERLKAKDVAWSQVRSFTVPRDLQETVTSSLVMKSVAQENLIIPKAKIVPGGSIKPNDPDVQVNMLRQFDPDLADKVTATGQEVLKDLVDKMPNAQEIRKVLGTETVAAVEAKPRVSEKGNTADFEPDDFINLAQKRTRSFDIGRGSVFIGVTPKGDEKPHFMYLGEKALEPTWHRILSEYDEAFDLKSFCDKVDFGVAHGRQKGMLRPGDSHLPPLYGSMAGVARKLKETGARKYNHYFKDVSHLKYIDVYRVLSLFGVTDEPIAHAVKKLLVSGNRGHKDKAKDVQEAIDSLKRYKQMLKGDAKRKPGKD